MRVVGTAIIARAHLLKFIFSIDLSKCSTSYVDPSSLTIIQRFE